MSEVEISHEELEAFREEIEESIDSTIFILVSGQDEGPFEIDPFSLGLSEQTLAELSLKQRAIVKEELYKFAGITEGETKTYSTYFASDDESISVSVFEGHGTNDEGEEKPFYIHEVKHESGELDWQLSASQNPLL
ncbi:MAG: hypothetical protein Q7T54_01055 [Candidatus Levybacteria bacterium]|nr:hypothetical protein [Candidatus Levybacteria bacterium]